MLNILYATVSVVLSHFPGHELGMKRMHVRYIPGSGYFFWIAWDAVRVFESSTGILLGWRIFYVSAEPQAR